MEKNREFFGTRLGFVLAAAGSAVGRRSRLSPVGALRKLGGVRWVPLGWLLVFTPLVILAYFSVVCGWSLRYALDALGGLPASPAERYAEVSTGLPAIEFHLVLMAVTILIVMAGVRKGIERAGLILMPTLFVIVIGLALWAATLSGSGQGYSFYLRPSLDALLSPAVFQQAASQAFLSLSVGMGIMITYGS